MLCTDAGNQQWTSFEKPDTCVSQVPQIQAHTIVIRERVQGVIEVTTSHANDLPYPPAVSRGLDQRDSIFLAHPCVSNRHDTSESSSGRRSGSRLPHDNLTVYPRLPQVATHSTDAFKNTYCVNTPLPYSIDVPLRIGSSPPDSQLP